MSTILRTEGLSHRYAGTWAIRDINIEIAEAGITGLLGANGAGKSTTMNIICGVLSQTEGRVTINGIDIREKPEQAKRYIGFLPQHPPLYPDLTIDEYLTYCAELRFIPQANIKSSVGEVKERCGISHFSSRLIRNLSGGYQQRVGIAQAIIHKPRLVVLDEPTNGLDPNQLIEARKLIKEISREYSVLLSSHILTEINLLCKNIIMIEGGRVIFSDTMNAFDTYLRPNTLRIVMDSPPVLEMMLAIEGIAKVTMINSREFRVDYDGDERTQGRLITAAVHNNWNLRELNVEKPLLDDTFKQLSTGRLQ